MKLWANPRSQAPRAEVAGVPEKGRSSERPQSARTHPAPQPFDKGQGWRRQEGGGG